MLDQSFEFRRKLWEESQLRLQHFEFDDHVPKKLAARCVRKRSIVRKLVNLTDVVQKYARQKQVAVHLRIVPANQIARSKERDHMIEQAADISMMQCLRRRSVAIGCGDLRIGHKSLHE